MVYIYQGIQYSVPSCSTTNPMELQKAIIHLTRRCQFSITNVYLPLHCSDYSKHQDDQSLLDHLQKEPSLACGDFNAHCSFWDDYVSTDLRDSALYDWIEAHSKVLINDGSPTRAMMCDQNQYAGCLAGRQCYV